MNLRSAFTIFSVCFSLFYPADTYIVFIRLHFPLLYRMVNAMDRASQSIPMAAQTPKTPKPHRMPSNTAVPRRNTTMEPMPMYMVIFTSPDARRLFARLKEVG